MLVFNGHDMSGPTANRPTNAEIGQPFFDTTLNVLMVWNGTIWDPVGNETSFVSVAAAGTNQGTGAALVEGFNNVTAADGTKGVTLPVAAAGQEVAGYNNSASNLLVYPNTSGTINGGSANASVTIAAHTKFSFIGTSATNWSGGYSAGGTYATLTGSETLTNKTLTTPTIAYNAANPAAAGDRDSNHDSRSWVAACHGCRWHQGRGSASRNRRGDLSSEKRRCRECRVESLPERDRHD